MRTDGKQFGRLAALETRRQKACEEKEREAKALKGYRGPT